MSLCGSCLRCLNLGSTGESDLTHHQTVSELTEAVDSRCPICSYMWMTILNWYDVNQLTPESFDNEETKEELVKRPLTECKAASGNDGEGFSRYPQASFDFCASQAVMRGGLPYSTRAGGVDVRVINSSLLTESPSVTEITLSRNYFNDLSRQMSSTGDAEVLDTIGAWFFNCTTNHKICNENRSEWMPTRLVQISYDKKHFRVVETVSERVKGPYMTLSHRWGAQNSLKLTKNNSQGLRQFQSLKLLPQSWQDALQVCQCLGIDLLWIDSLCIIQDGDDQQDWSQESKLMDRVYSNSVCNIAAAVSLPRPGLFQNRSHQLVTRIQCNIDHPVLSPTAPGLHDLIINERLDGQALAFAPLNYRGWVYQERTLSHRTIHFLNDIVILECWSGLASETYPYGVHVGEDSLTPAQSTLSMDFEVLSEPSTNPAEVFECTGMCSWCRRWSYIVLNLSRSHLTYNDDRPWAINGICAKIEQISGDKCVAGLWLRHLRNQLLWKQSANDLDRVIDKDRPSTRQVPSFSWLSTDYEVFFIKFDKVRRTFHVRIVNYECTELQLNPDNKRTEQFAKLEIEGKLKQVILRGYYKKGGRPRWYVCEYPVEGYKGPKDPRTLYAICPVYTADADYTQIDLAPLSSQGNEHFLLYICQDIDFAVEYRCLVLEVVNRAEATFRRIGVCDLFRPESVEIFDISEDESQSYPGSVVGNDGMRRFYLV